jgi:hypothetical protein
LAKNGLSKRVRGIGAEAPDSCVQRTDASRDPLTRRRTGARPARALLNEAADEPWDHPGHRTEAQEYAVLSHGRADGESPFRSAQGRRPNLQLPDVVIGQ